MEGLPLPGKQVVARSSPDEEDRMLDLLMFVMSVAFFIVAVAYTTACTKLR
jgi:uncharacterized membrane protein